MVSAVYGDYFWIVVGYVDCVAGSARTLSTADTKYFQSCVVNILKNNSEYKHPAVAAHKAFKLLTKQHQKSALVQDCQGAFLSDIANVLMFPKYISYRVQKFLNNPTLLNFTVLIKGQISSGFGRGGDSAQVSR